MRSRARSLPVWSGLLLAVAAVTLFVGYASLVEDPYGDGDCFPSQSDAGFLLEALGLLVFLVIAYGTFAVTRPRSNEMNRRWVPLVLGVLAVGWIVFVFWVFTPATAGLDLRYDWDGEDAPTRWVMALGPVAALLIATGCLVAVDSSRLARSRWRYLLGLPFACLATAGLLVAAIAPFYGTYCGSF